MSEENTDAEEPAPLTTDDQPEVKEQPEKTQPEKTQPEKTQPEKTQPEETQPEEVQQEETELDPAKPRYAQPKNPLHGIKLADIVEYLVEQYGWEELGHRININCFNYDPSVKSSLKFLRKTQWARDKVEQLYLRTIKNRK